MNVVPSRDRLPRILGLASPDARVGYRKLLEFTGSRGMPERLMIFANQYPAAFLRIMDRWCLAQGKMAWLEKTPGHLRKIAYISRWIPGARFIHVVRVGAHAIASRVDATRNSPEIWGSCDVDFCIREWIRDVRITASYRDMAGHLIVGYRALAEDTATEMRRVLDWLGLPFEAEVLTAYSATAPRLVLSVEKWKATVASPINNRDGEKFQTVLTPAEQERVSAAVAEVNLAELGVT